MNLNEDNKSEENTFFYLQYIKNYRKYYRRKQWLEFNNTKKRNTTLAQECTRSDIVNPVRYKATTMQMLVFHLWFL